MLLLVQNLLSLLIFNCNKCNKILMTVKIKINFKKNKKLIKLADKTYNQIN